MATMRPGSSGENTVAAQPESLGDAPLVLLVGVFQMLQAQLLAVPEHPNKVTGVGSPRYDDHLGDTRLHQGIDGIKDHGLVVDGQKVLVGGVRQWV